MSLMDIKAGVLRPAVFKGPLGATVYMFLLLALLTVGCKSLSTYLSIKEQFKQK